MTKPTKLTNEQMRPGQEVEQHLREYGHLPDTGCCGLETNFIEEQQREAVKDTNEEILTDILENVVKPLYNKTGDN